MSQKTAQEVGLNQTQINVILNSKKGYPTFGQRSSGRFRCNQVPELGLLKPRHLSSIRAQVGVNRNVGNMVTIETFHVPTVHIDNDGDARCPRCDHWNFSVSPHVITTCSGCGMKFNVVR